MKRFFALFALCVISPFALAATLAADISSNGKTLDAKIGDVIEIKLDGNPTTGYSWSVTKIDGVAIKQSGEAEYQQKNNDGRVGGGGTFTFKFTAEQVGQTTLNLGYARPWEKVDPIQSFTLTVKVQAAAPATRPATQPVILNPNVTKAKVDISNIENALRVFKADTERYPTNAEGLNILIENNRGVPNWRGPYMLFVLDPWANDYQYQYPGKLNTNGYDVVSAGSDGKFNTPDDIHN